MRLALVVLASCSSSPHSHWRTECPPGASELRVGDVQYCLISCHGAIEDGVHHTGTDFVGRFDDGIVVALQRGGADGFYVATPSGAPEAVCRWLPHGCRCTTPACKFAEARWTAIRNDDRAVMPRCEASDPDCGPEAFRGVCVASLGFQPGVARRPIGRGHDPNRPCSFDGECVNSGCGYQCLSVRTLERGTTFTCIGHPATDALLDRALCGCVEGSCSWFEVDRTR
jgi:hypothetical protein